MIAPLFARRRAAFSLVEVALAVGLAAFSLVAVVGLLNVGIDASHVSADDTVLGQIMQDVASRVRSEVASVNLSVDPTQLDLTWNPTYFPKKSSLSYQILSNMMQSSPASGNAIASAYYTHEGVFVKQVVGATVPPTNFYKAEITIQPALPPPTPAPPATPLPTPTPGDYPFLAVTVRVGWPTDNTVNGNVLGAANAAKSTFTFYLPKP